MKVELLGVAAALAAGVSAVPLRVITITGPVPHLAPADVAHNLHAPQEGEMRIMPHPHPCPGKMRGGGSSSSPFSDLLARLGFAPPQHGHGHGHEHEHAYGNDMLVPPEHGSEEKGNMMIEGWRHHVDEMFGKILPIIEGGEVKILPVLDHSEARHGHEHEQGSHRHHGQKKYGGPGGHLRPHGGHHWRHKGSDFGSRLHRAMMHLSPPEAITLAFVLGAGIGSIMHLVFMLFLISLRRIRGRGRGSEARRAERRQRKEARRAAKREGGLRLEDDHKPETEVLPSYAEGESDRLVEKA